MKKIVRLTESELVKLTKKIISEQQDPHGGEVPKGHPINNPFYKQMINDIDGEGVTTIKYVPNKMLVVDAFGNKYTITKG
jgi:hypothetical protein